MYSLISLDRTVTPHQAVLDLEMMSGSRREPRQSNVQEQRLIVGPFRKLSDLLSAMVLKSLAPGLCFWTSEYMPGDSGCQHDAVDGEASALG